MDELPLEPHILELILASAHKLFNQQNHGHTLGHRWVLHSSCELQFWKAKLSNSQEFFLFHAATDDREGPQRDTPAGLVSTSHVVNKMQET